jgi:type IV pilus assembly protein PilA
LVVSAIAILAGIVIVAINPAKQLGDTRNAQRRSDVNTILNAVYQYMIDNNGTLPNNISTGNCASVDTEICATGAASCTNLTSLASTTENQKYVVTIPSDPSGATTTNGTGYRVAKNIYGRITVCAVGAEQGAAISVTR